MHYRLVSDPGRKLLLVARLRSRRALLGTLLCAASALYSQTDANVSGTVTDPSGAHVVGATVTAFHTRHRRRDSGANQ